MSSQKRLSPAQIRKQQLVVEGLMYRTRILESKQAIKESKVVAWVTDGRLEQTTDQASSWVQMLLRYRSLMPVALSSASLLARWVWRKPLLYSGIIASALGFYLKLQSSEKTDAAQEHSPEDD